MAYASLEDAAVNGWEVERQYLCQAHGDSSPSASLNMNGFYFCVPPETRLLTADLRWIPIGIMEPGQKLIAFDEFPVQVGNSKRRQFRVSEVLRTKRVVQTVYRLTLSDGSVLTSSAGHSWLVYSGKDHAPVWVQTDNLVAGYHRLSKAFDVWGEPNTYDHGYVAGSLIGRYDPIAKPTIVSIENLGEAEVVAMETSTKTYIAEGFASHNCYACGDRGKLDMSKIEVTPVAVKKLVERVNDKLADNRKIYSESWLDIFDGDGPGDYWLSRFTREACEFYRLGRTSERATYPMRGDNGEVLGVVYRNHDNPKRKYEYPMNVRVSNHLFDIHRVESRDLVLVEGATDAIACWDVGAHVAVASYRAGISDEQARKIRKYDPRILWVAYDMDEAGKAGFRQVKEALPDVNVRRMTWFDFKDLASIPLRLRAELLSTVLI